MSTATMQMQTAPIDGLKIRYADSGPAHGPVILLTSPWPESLLAFRRVWPFLTQTGRLVAVDLPGFGHSEGRPDVLPPPPWASSSATSFPSSAWASRTS